MNKLRVAIIGQGRSGKLIHGAYFKGASNIHYEVAYVVEFDEERRKKAETDYPECVGLCDYTELFGKTDVDLVVNASYSQMHYSITLDLIEHGFNVLVEKPFGATRYECDRLMLAAKQKGVTLACFQQTNSAPFYYEAKALADSGKLGEIKQISIRYNGLSRRWDWQTMQSKVAGSVFNTGPHPIGMALGFLDFDENIRVEFSRLGTALTSGDAEDYAKIILSAPNKPIVDIEISSIDAYTDYNLKLQGTKGTYKGTASGGYKMKYIVDGENVERPLIVESLSNAAGEPVYCSEKLITHEEEGKYNGDAFTVGVHNFYENLYAVMHGEAELCFPPYQVARIIGIIEQIHTENPLPLKY